MRLLELLIARAVTLGRNQLIILVVNVLPATAQVPGYRLALIIQLLALLIARVVTPAINRITISLDNVQAVTVLTPGKEPVSAIVFQ
jgi:hypothetical protein